MLVIAPLSGTSGLVVLMMRSWLTELRGRPPIPSPAGVRSGSFSGLKQLRRELRARIHAGERPRILAEQESVGAALERESSPRCRKSCERRGAGEEEDWNVLCAGSSPLRRERPPYPSGLYGAEGTVPFTGTSTSRLDPGPPRLRRRGDFVLRRWGTQRRDVPRSPCRINVDIDRAIDAGSPEFMGATPPRLPALASRDRPGLLEESLIAPSTAAPSTMRSERGAGVRPHHGRAPL